MEIFLYTLKTVAYAVVSPTFSIMLLILGIVFYRKNKKVTVMQKMIIGNSIDSAFELTISQIVLGILAGAFGSLCLSSLGISFYKNSAIYLMFIISIILMNFNSRFICFSYSGAVLGIMTIINRVISDLFKISPLSLFDINIVSLMSLVGVLHIVEGLLVIGDGSRGSIPVIANKNDSIIGGFILKRYWALPIAIFIMINNSTTGTFNSYSSINIPNWWPLIKGTINFNILKSSMLYFLPIYAVIGYRSITFTKTKRKKSILSGSMILIYGIVLILVSQLARIDFILKIAVIIFAPLAHELMVRIDMFIELNGEAKFVSREDGIMILDVAPNSLAYEMGMETGDLIVEINDKKIEFEKEVVDIIKQFPNLVCFKIKKHTGELVEVSSNKVTSNKKLGAVLVPRYMPEDVEEININGERFKDILDRIKNNDKN